MDQRTLDRYQAIKDRERSKINSGQIEAREVEEAGGQFDYILRKAQREGLDFRVEW